MNVFATTSYSERIGSQLPKVLQNMLEQTLVPDAIKVYLSLDEFSNKELDLPEALTSLVTNNPIIQIVWTPGNYKSFKKLFAIKNNPNCNLVIFDDDTIHGKDWFKACIDELNTDPNVVHVGWVDVICEDYKLKKVYSYGGGRHDVNYYNSSEGLILNTNLYKKLQFDLKIPMKCEINDDDYYFHINNVIFGIKYKWFNYRGYKFKLPGTSMKDSGYTYKNYLLYLKRRYPTLFDLYMERKHEMVKGLTVISSKECK